MRKVIGIGESILDIIFRKDTPVGAVPGGSVFNAIVSLGRCGVPATFVSEVGDDRVGRMTVDFLERNGVDASAVKVVRESKSPVSLAFLDEANNAEYLFYKEPLRGLVDQVLPSVGKDDIVLLGSFYAVNPDTRQQTAALLEQARREGAIVYYDVNFRPSHVRDLLRTKPFLLENLEQADIVRGSREDFLTLFQLDSAERVYRQEISFYCPRFIYTDGARPATLFADGVQRQFQVAPVETISTVGAGDNFNAGIIFGLIRERITRQDLLHGLVPNQWNRLVQTAMAFSAECCKTLDNYVGLDFANSMKL